jgi:outer membrane protein TolC
MRAQASAEASARIQAEKARLAAGDQIHADWQKVRAAVTKVKAARAQVAAARRAQQLATERYQAGVATQLDTIQTDRDVFSAEVNDIQARGELAAARLALRISAGLPLEAQP